MYDSNSEEFQKSKAAVKQALLMGGMVVAPRSSGKTQALKEIMQEDPNAIAVVRNEETRRQLMKALGDVGKDRVFLFDTTESSILFGKLDGKRLYGDELTFAQVERLSDTHMREFHASTVKTVPFPIRVVKV